MNEENSNDVIETAANSIMDRVRQMIGKQEEEETVTPETDISQTKTETASTAESPPPDHAGENARLRAMLSAWLPEGVDLEEELAMVTPEGKYRKPQVQAQTTSRSGQQRTSSPRRTVANPKGFDAEKIIRETNEAMYGKDYYRDDRNRTSDRTLR